MVPDGTAASQTEGPRSKCVKPGCSFTIGKSAGTISAIADNGRSEKRTYDLVTTRVFIRLNKRRRIPALQDEQGPRLLPSVDAMPDPGGVQSHGYDLPGKRAHLCCTVSLSLMIVS